MNIIRNENIFLETPRLLIKSLDEGDYDVYKIQQKDAYLTEFFGGPRNNEKLKRYLIYC